MSMIDKFKKVPLRTKILGVAAVAIISYAGITMFGGNSAMSQEDVVFGDPSAFSETQAMTGQVATDASSTDMPNMPTNPNLNKPKFKVPPKVSVPQFNTVVEISKLIDNVRNKPEALLDVQLNMGIATLDKRVRLQQLLSTEQESKVKYQKDKMKLDEMRDGASTETGLIVADINPMSSMELLNVKYNPNEFRLVGLKPTKKGYVGVVEYKNEFYSAIKGKELVALVKVQAVKKDRVVLNTPSIGVFEVPLQL